ncbi:MAG: 2-C-methyl-D-erythritol 4-phosphate cytidylyltransferase [Candidatus Beckwithbacteria bacterium]
MISAIITAAGNCTRFGREKLFSLIKGEPVFIKTVKQFLKVKAVDEVILVVRQDNRKKFEKWLKKLKIKARLVVGGKERYDSAANGVRAARGEYVLIHDGARPLVTTKLINRVIQAVLKHKAVMAGVETTTCVKVINPKTMEVIKCLERQRSWLGQTPQAFKREVILKAYEAVRQGKITGMDDCELVRKLGIKVMMIEGEWTNKKVTLPTDLEIIRKWSKYV